MLRLRQICLVARDLAPVEDALRAVFGVEVCHRDPGVRRFGLHNVLLPIGHQFLEIVAPIEAGTAAGRYLDRRGGDGGYMVIMQCHDVDAARARLAALSVRLVTDTGDDDGWGLQLHPRDLPGAIVELRRNSGDADPAGPWRPAGRDWKRAVRTSVISAITAAELQTDDPGRLAARWSHALDRPVVVDSAENPVITLDDATLRFVSVRDGRGEGLGGLDLRVSDRGRLLAAAEARGYRTSEDEVTICGTRFRLV